MYYVVGNTSSGHASWWLYANNNKMVAWAGEEFASRWNAERAARAFKSGASTARYEIYSDLAGLYRWRAWRSSDKVAASGESFSSRSAAETAANNVRDHAGEGDLAA